MVSRQNRTLYPPPVTFSFARISKGLVLEGLFFKNNYARFYKRTSRQERGDCCCAQPDVGSAFELRLRARNLTQQRKCIQSPTNLRVKIDTAA